MASHAQFQQAQMDNERLLSELRSHKKRADELQAKNEQLAQRLDESERLLAERKAIVLPTASHLPKTVRQVLAPDDFCRFRASLRPERWHGLTRP